MHEVAVSHTMKPGARAIILEGGLLSMRVRYVQN